VLDNAVNGLINRIYDDVREERPWIASLESLRALIPCHTMAIEAVDENADQATYYFAAGRRVDASDIGVWEEASQFRDDPIPFESSKPVIFNDWRSACPAPGFLQLLEKYDVLRSMSVGILQTEDKVRYSLHSGRSIQASGYSMEEQELFLQVAQHFARAIQMRLDLNRARTSDRIQADAMERLSVGGLVIDVRCRVLFANDTALRLLQDSDGLILRNGHLRSAGNSSAADLRELIKALVSTAKESDPVRALTIERSLGRGSLYVVLRRQRARESISDRWQDVIQVYIHDPELSYCEDSTIFQQLFNLTRSEAAIAAAMSKGNSVDEIEASLKITHNTMRAHLRAIFAKTNVGSRAELIRVLNNCAGPLANLRAV
jgi:DNA-binding CsgD family transcriptional regulator